jgi:CheY-like chemotaxis protein
MPRTILFVEDEPAHAALMVEACQLAGIHHTHFVENGRAARDYLLKLANGGGGEKSLPLLIFVDLNMPELAAPEFLEWLRSHARIR